jgi:hypothetical protein
MANTDKFITTLYLPQDLKRKLDEYLIAVTGSMRNRNSVIVMALRQFLEHTTREERKHPDRIQSHGNSDEMPNGGEDQGFRTLPPSPALVP